MVNLDVSSLLVPVILFVLLFVLQRLYFKPLSGIFQKRSQILEENKNAFNIFLIKYNEIESILNERIREAMNKVEEHKEKMRKEAQAEGNSIVEDAKLRAEELKRETINIMEKEFEGSKRIIEKELENLADRLMERILEEKI